MSDEIKFHDRILSLSLARVTEAAALASAKLIGRGDEKAADQAAVDAMRSELNKLEINGVVVIGEGERDEAPMLYIGEKVGKGNGPDVDIALDPLEGTTLTAKDMPNALAVIAMGPKNTMLHAPDVYMDKLAIGPGFEDNLINLDMSPSERITTLAKAKKCNVEEITVCILERPRHEDLIEEIRTAGASIRLITDGDVAGVMHCAEWQKTGIDIYMGSGGAPEGVLAAAALKCMGGQIQGRLTFRNDDEKDRAFKAGIKDLNKIYSRDEMVQSDVLFAATGVTDGSLLNGIKRSANFIETDTMLMRSKTGSVRRLNYQQKLNN
ncbi:MAG: fructose-bisphosphatase class II [Rhodobacteraceae bacterium]|jgi:fructose-1,6-bisphosphatase II / sedoheptulose-1,7-bisphosphatase|nr:fructose-bisphosphatase class II [Paracoccaceae bacterium]MBV03527.1 fructose-bisphosphatase class II [Paracoccaceae bacterium]MDG1879751.1 class II fructose-bisphosphatase [Paracoccaceae bacterium]MDG1939321.1 class II fructose-bisphosphatase [Paracoccaceae bacterium]|tara:strand:+ start:3135 stop:4103 length:969 start_codon:yes stop_codon:yes gene_type:complete